MCSNATCKIAVTPSRQRRWQSERGTSLVEAIVGIVLLVVMLATTTPVVSRILQQFELRGACQRVFSELQDARMASLAQNRRYRWQLDTERSYSVSRYDIVTDTWSIVRTGDLSRDTQHVTLTSLSPIVFSPNGSSPLPGSVTLTGNVGTVLQVTVRNNGSIFIQ